VQQRVSAATGSRQIENNASLIVAAHLVRDGLRGQAIAGAGLEGPPGDTAALKAENQRGLKVERGDRQGINRPPGVSTYRDLCIFWRRVGSRKGDSRWLKNLSAKPQR
jgi:hypothetical protein